MDGPKEMLAGIVERWKNGDDVLAQLELHDEFLESWAKTVQEIPTPEGFDVGAKLQSMALEGLQLLWEASGAVREAILRGNPEGAAAALKLAAAGQELVDEVMFLTREKLDELESE